MKVFDNNKYEFQLICSVQGYSNLILNRLINGTVQFFKEEIIKYFKGITYCTKIYNDPDMLFFSVLLAYPSQ